MKHTSVVLFECRIFQRKYPEFDEVLKISEENQVWPMASPEKKFILILLPPEDGSNCKF